MSEEYCRHGTPLREVCGKCQRELHLHLVEKPTNIPKHKPLLHIVVTNENGDLILEQWIRHSVGLGTFEGMIGQLLFYLWYWFFMIAKKEQDEPR